MGLDRHFAHAPQHISDTDMWGVSDPAGRPRGRVCDAQAGSLTPLPCCDTCAGALTGRHKSPPVLAAAPAPTSRSFKGLRRLGDRQSLQRRGKLGINAPSARGANRALALRPPPRPPDVTT